MVLGLRLRPAAENIGEKLYCLFEEAFSTVSQVVLIELKFNIIFNFG